MKNYIDFVIDIETMGLAHNAPILQVGVCAIDRQSGRVLDSAEWGVDVDEYNNDPDFVTDVSTVKWWSTQDSATFAKVLSGELSIVEVLDKLEDFMVGLCVESDLRRVWGNSPSFDLDKLKYAYTVYGLDVPWMHWNERCLRTICDENDVDWHKHLKDGDAHTALGDAVAEAKGILECDTK